MNFLNSLIEFFKKQDTFIKIGFLVGAGFLILFAGYVVGGFVARITS